MHLRFRDLRPGALASEALLEAADIVEGPDGMVGRVTIGRTYSQEEFLFRASSFYFTEVAQLELWLPPSSSCG